jgi:hypothetical protein
MKQTIIILLLAFGMKAQTWEKIGTGTMQSDTKHFYVSAIGTTLIGTTVNHYIDKPMLSTWIGGVSMFGIGLGKELIYDGMMKRGVKSKQDVFINGWGSLVGMMTCRVVIDIKYRNHDSRRSKRID